MIWFPPKTVEFHWLPHDLLQGTFLRCQLFPAFNRTLPSWLTPNIYMIPVESMHIRVWTADYHPHFPLDLYFPWLLAYYVLGLFLLLSPCLFCLPLWDKYPIKTSNCLNLKYAISVPLWWKMYTWNMDGLCFFFFFLRTCLGELFELAMTAPKIYCVSGLSFLQCLGSIIFRNF